MLANTLTKLSLARWAQIMGLNPLHAAGVQLQALSDESPICGQALFRYEYQDHDRVGREQIARAIAEAEADIEHFLGWRLLPSWEADERVTIPRPSRPELYGWGGDVRWYQPAATTRWKKVISGGIRGSTLISAGAAIAYSDSDGDGYKETATVTVASTVTPCDVRLFYPGQAGAPAWEIRPVTAVASGGNVVIAFRRELCLKDEIDQALDVDGPADGLTDGNFLTTVDVYRVWNDPQTQVSFLWEPSGLCNCGTDGCGQCSYATQTGCLVPRDPRLGLMGFGASDWSVADSAFTPAAWGVSRHPDLARLYYYSGNRDESQLCPATMMDPDWERTVAYYAASKLDRPLCDCSAAYTEKWQEEMGFERGAKEIASYRLSDVDLNNPFGTARGAIYAWRRVSRFDAAILTQAVAVV